MYRKNNKKKIKKQLEEYNFCTYNIYKFLIYDFIYIKAIFSHLKKKNNCKNYFITIFLIILFLYIPEKDDVRERKNIYGEFYIKYIIYFYLIIYMYFFTRHIDFIPKVICDLIIVSRNLPIWFARANAT